MAARACIRSFDFQLCNVNLMVVTIEFSSALGIPTCTREGRVLLLFAQAESLSGLKLVASTCLIVVDAPPEWI